MNSPSLTDDDIHCLNDSDFYIPKCLRLDSPLIQIQEALFDSAATSSTEPLSPDSSFEISGEIEEIQLSDAPVCKALQKDATKCHIFQCKPIPVGAKICKCLQCDAIGCVLAKDFQKEKTIVLPPKIVVPSTPTRRKGHLRPVRPEGQEPGFLAACAIPEYEPISSHDEVVEEDSIDWVVFIKSFWKAYRQDPVMAIKFTSQRPTLPHRLFGFEHRFQFTEDSYIRFYNANGMHRTRKVFFPPMLGPKLMKDVKEHGGVYYLYYYRRPITLNGYKQLLMDKGFLAERRLLSVLKFDQ